MKQGLCNLVYSETGPLRKKQKLYNFHNNSILLIYIVIMNKKNKISNIDIAYKLPYLSSIRPFYKIEPLHFIPSKIN
jgi:hypothetical protein